MSNKNLGLDELLMRLDYRLTPQGVWCRKYSMFAEKMAQLIHPKMDVREFIALDDIVEGLVSDYEHQMDTCQNLSEHIADNLATQCFVHLRIQDGIVNRSLQSKETILFEDKIPYETFRDLALGELFSYPVITPRSKWKDLRKWLGIFVSWCVINGVFMAVGEHRYIAGFAEATVATSLYLSGTFLPVFVGIYAGVKIKEKLASRVFGWIFGIFICIALFAVFQTASRAIPGVGWRLEKMTYADE